MKGKSDSVFDMIEDLHGEKIKFDWKEASFDKIGEDVIFSGNLYLKESDHSFVSYFMKLHQSYLYQFTVYFPICFFFKLIFSVQQVKCLYRD
jgi:hypothetical protein